MSPRFLQIHTLNPYAAVLLNRDDDGIAKRLPYGGVSRTRIASQSLKRHWRMTDDLNALERISVPSFRSRNLVERIVEQAQSKGGTWDDQVARALVPWFRFAIYGTRPEDTPNDVEEASRFDEKRQPLLFGLPEIEWLGGQFARLVAKSNGNPETAHKLVQQWLDGKGAAGSRKAFLANMSAMRNSAQLPGGLTAALFGRFVTSDPEADITGPIHVAHAFTVHEEEAETDYLTAVDDLTDAGSSAATIQETELTSGLFYGYVVVDIPGLVANLGEKPPDAPLTGKVLYSLIHLIAEVSPGAKLGSTAPYSRAALMLLEAGERQPRSLAEAYRTPCAPQLETAARALATHLAGMDALYATGEQRRVLSMAEVEFPNAEPASLAELANWAQGLPQQLPQ